MACKKLFFVFVAFVFVECTYSNDTLLEEKFDQNNRVWIGEDFWSIPMEDWRIENKRLEFTGSHRRSRINVLSHILAERDGEFTVSISVGSSDTLKHGSVGFSLGVKDSIDADVKAACYYGKGLDIGVSTTDGIFIGNKKTELPVGFSFSEFELHASGSTVNGKTKIVFTAKDKAGLKAEITTTTSGSLNGLFVLVNSFAAGDKKKFHYDNLKITGSKVEVKMANAFGPILWTMYTLNQGSMKMSVQMPPISKDDNHAIELELYENEKWISVATETIDTVGYQAIFRKENWSMAQEKKYRVKYISDSGEHFYEGIIRQEPIDKPLVIGGLTCQEGEGYPYSPLIKQLKEKNPDLLYFSGDQLYEQNGDYPIKRSPIKKSIESYLGKWYMFGWAFGDVMRDRPTICTPDDHDVFQGNLWGEEGKLISIEDWELVKDAHGGFVQSPEMVNTVFRTQCGHLPDPVDAQPLPSGINVWYTSMVYSNVSFAILSDRMFKSGPEEIIKNETGRIDHVKKPMNPKDLDAPTLSILGQRQIKFLKEWVEDWSYNATTKILLTQTVFSNIPTHHGPDRMFLYGDLDSGGWPKTARDEVIDIMRKAQVFHLNGDQHIPMIVKYGLQDFGDAGWSFCTPAISTGYMRGFLPDSLKIPVANRPSHNLPNTGEYQDVFGNKNFVYAVSNPVKNIESPNRYTFVNNKASGFGILEVDPKAHTLTMHAYPFLSQGEEFPGWPLTVHQRENDGRTPLGYLPELRLNRASVVVKVVSENTNELVSTFRTEDKSIRLPVFKKGTYTVIVSDAAGRKELTGLKVDQSGKDFIDIEL